MKDEEDKTLKLNKSLYLMKQSPRSWNKRIDKFLKQMCHFNTFKHEIYVKGPNQGNVNIMWIYVDDLHVTRSNYNEIESHKLQMNTEFDMTNQWDMLAILNLIYVTE